jgi:PAS domain S-box-containing protein
LSLSNEKGLLETIFQSIHEGILVLDADGQVNYANNSAEHLLGFNSKDIKGKHIEDYIPGVHWDRIISFDESEWSRLVSRDIEITYPEYKLLNFYVVPFSKDQNKPDGLIVILRDIMDKRMQEESTINSERFEAIQLLAASVAHEIGNPLNALNIHLQLMQRETNNIENEKVRDNIEELNQIAIDEVSRLDAIITEFLKAIRPSKPSLKTENIQTILEETLMLIKNDVANRNIEIDVNTSGVLPLIKVDKGQIKQAFFNVIKNALQVMPDGGKLMISLSSSDEFLGIAFRDTGTGISKDDFPRVFDPYHTTKETGSGLGLMIVKRIVQDHGGQIELVSQENKGTIFTILLPLIERRVRLLTSD